MRITCECGHDVCTVPDGMGWEIHAKNFTDWGEGQRKIDRFDFIHSLSDIREHAELSEIIEPLPGQCWCGAPYCGRDENHIFRIHTADGWQPKEEDLK